MEKENEFTFLPFPAFGLVGLFPRPWPLPCTGVLVPRVPCFSAGPFPSLHRPLLSSLHGPKPSKAAQLCESCHALEFPSLRLTDRPGVTVRDLFFLRLMTGSDTVAAVRVRSRYA